MPSPVPEPDACRIARSTLETYFREGRVTYGPEPAPTALSERARVAVSLFSGNDLRGCMISRGIMPTTAREIAFCALQAATADPLRRPIHPTELAALEIGVAIFGERRLVADGDQPAPADALEIEDDDGHVALVMPGCGGRAEALTAAGIPAETAVRAYTVAVDAFGRQPSA